MNQSENTSMRAHYIGAWRFFGGSVLTNGTAMQEVGEQHCPFAKARLVDDPEHFFEHFDRSRAALSLLMQGLFRGGREGAFQDRFEHEVGEVRRRRLKETKRGAYLVVEGEIAVEPVGPKMRTEVGGFALALDEVDNDAVRAAFRPFASALLTATAICLNTNADRQHALVGEIIYLIEDDVPKPIYSFRITGNPVRISISHPLDAAIMTSIARVGAKLISDTQLERSSRLLTLSHDRKTDPLQAFLAAWSALEIFVNKGFSSYYEKQWFELLESAAPSAVAPVFERLRVVMRDKYRLADKFLVIAATLSPESVAADASEFASIKKVRDMLLHGEQVEPPFPTEAIQRLLHSYMGLHLNA